MIVYADASLLVSAYTQEAASDLAEGWLGSPEAVGFRSSAWCETEVASALAAEVRSNTLSTVAAKTVLRVLQVRLTLSSKAVAIELVHFASAARLLTRSPKPLRASDALHLAIAASVGAAVVTLDRGMAEAG